IRTPFIERMGTTVGPLARRLFRGRKTKHWMRSYYALRSLRQLKRASLDEHADYWQAGKSVAEIASVEPVEKIVREMAAAIDV
ncbi:MAG TPA: nitronate monooxygenase, partial [Gemmatimonadaceae bacterium]